MCAALCRGNVDPEAAHMPADNSQDNTHRSRIRVYCLPEETRAAADGWTHRQHYAGHHASTCYRQRCWKSRAATCTHRAVVLMARPNRRWRARRWYGSPMASIGTSRSPSDSSGAACTTACFLEPLQAAGWLHLAACKRKCSSKARPGVCIGQCRTSEAVPVNGKLH